MARFNRANRAGENSKISSVGTEASEHFDDEANEDLDPGSKQKRKASHCRTGATEAEAGDDLGELTNFKDQVAQIYQNFDILRQHIIAKCTLRLAKWTHL